MWGFPGAGRRTIWRQDCRARYPAGMCNLYTWKMTGAEMRALKLHFQLIGTTWTEWEERQRGQNEPIKDVYPNRRAPVVILQDGQHIVREDMLWGFPPFKPARQLGHELPHP